MSLALLIIGISIVLVGIAILDRCNKIFSILKWLQRQFMGESPHITIDRHPNLALEFFTIKEKLTPLFFMPLASIATEINRMYEILNNQFKETLEVWRDIERKEMEAFDATSPPDGKAFIPSDNLKRSLRAWSLERHKANVIEKWTHQFTETYVELLSGKIPLSEAEERVKGINPIILNIRDPFKEAKVFNSWASNWEADKWKKRLNHLREMERWKNSSK